MREEWRRVEIASIYRNEDALRKEGKKEKKLEAKRREKEGEGGSMNMSPFIGVIAVPITICWSE